MVDRLGQEWIDQINARLFLAIARNDLNEVIESVAMGALINANDRFGHSPLHYAAYRGNAFIVDYLLRHGGDPNTRGNHRFHASAQCRLGKKPGGGGITTRGWCRSGCPNR